MVKISKMKPFHKVGFENGSTALSTRPRGGSLGRLKNLFLVQWSQVFFCVKFYKKVFFPPKIMFIRPLDHFLWNFEKWEFWFFFKKFYYRITAEIEIDRFEFLLYFCSKNFWIKFNFQNFIEKHLEVAWTWFLKKTKPF